MPEAEARAAFERANELWFADGATFDALAAYRQAVDLDPSDAVAWYQIARALWAVDRIDEARQAMATVESLKEQLSPRGKELAAATAAEWAAPRVMRHSLPVPAEDMDVSRLDLETRSAGQWLRVVSAAQERGMFGLAAHALRRAAAGTRGWELEEDAGDIEREAAAQWNRLLVMRPPHKRGPSAPVAPESKAGPVTAPAAHREDVGAIAQSAGSKDSTPRSIVPATDAAGLAVKARVDPVSSRVDEPLSLRVTLSNPTSRTIAVNGRLLLNHRSAPPGHGEVALDVVGPPGYFNQTYSRVRAGAAGPEHFRVLAPGASVTRDYRLTDYESLHEPGTYQLRASYTNALPASVGGLPAVVGTAVSELFTLERQAALPSPQPSRALTEPDISFRMSE